MSPNEFLLPFGIIASTLVALGTTAYCLSSGVFVVCSHLFYIPIVLAAYRHPERGVGIAVALAATHLAEVLLLSPGGVPEIANALVWAGVFLLVAAVVSHLAGRLRLREGRYRGIFETSGAGIFLFSPDDRKVGEMNRQCAAMLGYPDGEVLDVTAFWPGYPGNPAPVTNQDCEFIRRDGTSCPVLLSTSLLPDQEMNCAVVTGMTEQKRMENLLRRSEETFRVILNTVDVGIILTDPGRRIIEVNDAIVRLCGGAAREDLIGRDPETLFAERDLAMIRACRERVLHGEVLAPVECTLCRFDGSEWPAEVSVTLLAKDGDARFVDRFQERYPGHDDPTIRSFAAAPIPGDDGPVGCIAVASRTRETIPEDERLILATISEGLGSAVVKGMLLEGT
ncbi:PAS domain S-box protein [Methanoculleus bourgensis]|jgi:PAS domain S-box-containing protein|uniref:PAS domain S-box protein n=1 Tax=Methanoculleus bourgensis TaxID=83986 RepID=UPI003B92C05F